MMEQKLALPKIETVPGSEVLTLTVADDADLMRLVAFGSEGLVDQSYIDQSNQLVQGASNERQHAYDGSFTERRQRRGRIAAYETQEG